MPNALIHEKSPYLLQHADNPVDWLPWGEEAFARARAENKPVFLSIGYSTCHWCHVMAHESFEDPEIAATMNRWFINIKVDREERPDVDLAHMTYLHATGANGGWPLSAWLTPDLRPFLAGTYFPPHDRGGRPGFGTLTEQLGQLWRDDPDRLLARADSFLHAFSEMRAAAAAAARAATGLPGPEAADLAFQQFSRSFDPDHGGFSHAPKFPRPSSHLFLLRHAAHPHTHPQHRDHARHMVLHTLRHMALGGMRDHLGGGFHRYSVDPAWHVPHFEKMLYDQAQLVVSHLEAYELTRDPFFADTARSTLHYVLRDLAAPAGGIHSAEDADSFLDHTRTAHSEGAFYLWTADELADTLAHAGEDPDTIRLFATAYAVRPHGNVESQWDPFHEFTQRNILTRALDSEKLAVRFRSTPEQIETDLARCRAHLLHHRAQRPRPQLDTKIITAWNGLLLTALAKAIPLLDDPEHLNAALRAADFLHAHLRDPATGHLRRTWPHGPAPIPAFPADYAFLIQGLLDLYHATLDTRHLAWAVELQDILDQLHTDHQSGGGYLSVNSAHPHTHLSLQEDQDNAEPAPNSVAALNLLRLHALLHRDDHRQRAETILRVLAPALAQSPIGLPQLLVALDYHQATGQSLIIAAANIEDAAPLLREIHARPHYHRTLVHCDNGGPRQTWLAARSDFYATIPPAPPGQAIAYLCRDHACLPPVHTPEALIKLLEE